MFRSLAVSLFFLHSLAYAQTCPNGFDNRGTEFAVFDNISGDNVDYTWSQFKPETYKSIVPVYTGVTAEAGIVNRCETGNIRFFNQGPAEGVSCYERIIFQRVRRFPLIHHTLATSG